ncbi:MAG: hypothetical protein ACOVLE_15725, partial [Pirellula staleyi]
SIVHFRNQALKDWRILNLQDDNHAETGDKPQKSGVIAVSDRVKSPTVVLSSHREIASLRSSHL